MILENINSIDLVKDCEYLVKHHHYGWQICKSQKRISPNNRVVVILYMDNGVRVPENNIEGLLKLD